MGQLKEGLSIKPCGNEEEEAWPMQDSKGRRLDRSAFDTNVGYQGQFGHKGFGEGHDQGESNLSKARKPEHIESK